MEKILETKRFKNKKELALALLDGEVWRVKGVKGFCLFQEENWIRIESKIPFRFINKEEKIDVDLDGFWSCADNQTEWERLK